MWLCIQTVYLLSIDHESDKQHGCQLSKQAATTNVSWHHHYSKVGAATIILNWWPYLCDLVVT